MRSRATLTAIVLVLGLAGCESAPIGPEGQGEVSMGVQGGGVAESDASGASRSLSGSGSGSAEGSVDVQARVYLRTGTGEWVEVTRGAAQHTLRVDGSDGVQAFANGSLAVGAYSRVRVEFEQVRANLTSGLSLGSPLADAEVAVELGGDGKVVVEREVDLRVRAGAQARLTMNLNSDTWLGQMDSTTRTVAEGVFAAAVTITASEE
jgi:hypothetical protein